jgi:hypothetical protein
VLFPAFLFLTSGPARHGTQLSAKEHQGTAGLATSDDPCPLESCFNNYVVLIQGTHFLGFSRFNVNKIARRTKIYHGSNYEHEHTYKIILSYSYAEN